jgi:hypothetical protein
MKSAAIARFALALTAGRRCHARRGASWTELMKPVVEHLTTDDMMNIAAYAASLNP